MGLVVLSTGNGYCTKAYVRQLAGLTTTDVGDTDLDALIKAASAGLARDIATRVFGAKCAGLINGANVKYQMPDRYIADRDFNLAVDYRDITVRGVKKETDGTETRAVLTVATVDSFGGWFTVNAAPAQNAYDWIEADYETYQVPVYVHQLEEASANLVAHLVHMRNRVPGGVTVAQLRGLASAGGMEMMKGQAAWSVGSRWYAEYQRIVLTIRAGKVRGA